jgi:hypothetical protein
MNPKLLPVYLLFVCQLQLLVLDSGVSKLIADIDR